jgi:hypothetical protein
VVCALATYLSPPPVLRKRRAAPHGAPVRPRFGGGAAHRCHAQRAPYGQERPQAAKQPRRGRARASGLRRVPRRRRCRHGRAQSSGEPESDPVRRPAHLLPALHAGNRCCDRTLRSVSTCKRRPGPAFGPTPGPPCPCRVWALSGRDIVGPLDCGAGTVRLSEKADLRAACPIGVPAVPYRFPADSCAPWTPRP